MLELPALPLAIAFVVVGVAAWLLGRRSGAARVVRLPRDYFIGLDHLLNDRFDRAAEVFARVAQAEGDAVEIQFALGSLFRRRGEVDRAIAIHTRLREHGSAALRARATFALARDYLSAGLMDRAERLLEELTATREHREEALDHLVRVYEQQGDWANALKVFHQLPAAVQAQRRSVAAHYLCELAEHALHQGDTERVRALLRQARTHDPELARVEMLSARLTEACGDPHGALQQYLRSIESSPGLALEIIPRVLELSRTLAERRPLVAELAERLKRNGRISSRQVAWLLTTAVPADEAGEVRRLAGELLDGSPAAAEPVAVRSLLTRLGDAGGRYQCDDCGLHSVVWYWHCPKCRSWDSMRPVVFKWAERAEDAARTS